MARGFRGAGIAAAVMYLATGQAAAQEQKLGGDDLSTVMSAYVDSVAELRQFRSACGQDATGWSEASAMLAASLRAAGNVEEAAVIDVERRLAAEEPPAAYDCGSEASDIRLATVQPGTWSDLHQAVLSNLGVAVATAGAAADERLEAIRAVFAREIPAQERMLNCMALVEPRWFPVNYADWNGLLGELAADFENAGYTAALAEQIIAPARAGTLLKPVTGGRQAAIGECLANQDWVARYATFQWYGIGGEVRALLEEKQ